MITAIDMNHGLIVSGGKDNQVKIWDIKSKKVYSFSKHMNLITQVLVWDETCALTASADRSIRFWDIS
jgi:WD40 repeat protein